MAVITTAAPVAQPGSSAKRQSYNLGLRVKTVVMGMSEVIEGLMYVRTQGFYVSKHGEKLYKGKHIKKWCLLKV